MTGKINMQIANDARGLIPNQPVIPAQDDLQSVKKQQRMNNLGKERQTLSKKIKLRSKT